MKEGREGERMGRKEGWKGGREKELTVEVGGRKLFP